METVIEDEKFQRFVVNLMIPFPVMLKQAGLTGYSYNGKCFCPFHPNENTPSAKLFKSERGDSLFCFSENKKYYPADVIKEHILNKSLETVFQRIWKQLSDERKQEVLQIYGTPVDILPDKWKENREKIEMFRSGDTSLKEHLSLLVSALS